MTLCDTKNNDKLLINELAVEESERNYLMSLGFVPGRPVTVLQNHNGNMQIRILETVYTLDRSTAAKILVQPEKQV